VRTFNQVVAWALVFFETNGAAVNCLIALRREPDRAAIFLMSNEESSHASEHLCRHDVLSGCREPITALQLRTAIQALRALGSAAPQNSGWRGGHSSARAVGEERPRQEALIGCDPVGVITTATRCSASFLSVLGHTPGRNGTFRQRRGGTNPRRSALSGPVKLRSENAREEPAYASEGRSRTYNLGCG